VVYQSGKGSLLQTLEHIHNNKYDSIFMFEVEDLETEICNLQTLLLMLAFRSLFQGSFAFIASDKAIDLISLGVCLLKKQGTQDYWSIGEPWARIALLQFYHSKKINIQHQFIRNQIQIILASGGVKDSAKGKMLEWLTAIRLVSLKSSSFESIPLFHDAFLLKEAPSWFNSRIKTNAEQIVQDQEGRSISSIVNLTDLTSLTKPIKEARPDSFQLVNVTDENLQYHCLVCGCKFYSEKDNKELLSNLNSTNPDMFFRLVSGDFYSKDSRFESLRKGFREVLKKRNMESNGVIRLLVTLPDGIYKDNIHFEVQRDPSNSRDILRKDVILQVTKENLGKFFTPDDVKIIKAFFV